MRVAAICVAAMAMCMGFDTASADRWTPLSNADVRRVVDADTARVRRCYVRHAMRQRRADGRFHVALIVEADGRVRRARVIAKRIRGKRFRRCIQRIAKSWRCPEAASATDVTYPFHFVHSKPRRARPKRARRSRKTASNRARRRR